MELLKGYDFTLEYHPGKANVVVDALSRNPRGIAASIMAQEWLMLETASEFGILPSGRKQEIFLGSVSVQPTLISRIIQGQAHDEFSCAKLAELVVDLLDVCPSEWSVGLDGGLRYRWRLCVPDSCDLKGEILWEAHRSRYTVHPWSTKMYKVMRRQFWWNGMKKDVAEYVSKCLTCQQVKAEHQRPGGLLQPLSIPTWKWE